MNSELSTFFEEELRLSRFPFFLPDRLRKERVLRKNIKITGVPVTTPPSMKRRREF
jgi:hypothetical protein